MIGKLKELGNSLLNSFFQVKEKTMIDDVELEILTEYSKTTTVSVTNRRVEKGFNIADTARKEPLIFSITAMDNSFNRDINKQKLYKILDLAEPIVFSYAGKDSYENMIVESIEEVEDSTYKNCCIYCINLRQIQVAEIKAEDTKVSYKEAKTSGGNKQRVGANISEVNGAGEKAVERGKSGLKTIFGGK